MVASHRNKTPGNHQTRSMRQLHVTCLVLWSWYVSQGCHAWGVGATDGYVSRSMPVPENPDYSEQLYSADSFKPEPFIADAETWCRSNLPGLPKASRLMCETFPRSTVLMAYQGTRAGVHNCREAFAVSSRADFIQQDTFLISLMLTFSQILNKIKFR